jgi:hypothetical protein
VTDDSTLGLWDPESGESISSIRTEPWSSVHAFSPDGRRIAWSAWNNALVIWDTESGDEPRKLTGHSSHVRAIAFSPDGLQTVSASGTSRSVPVGIGSSTVHYVDNTLKLWDAVNGKELKTFIGHTNSPDACVFSPDGLYLCSISFADETLRVWDTATGAQLCAWGGSPSTKPVFSAGGTCLAVGTKAGSVELLRIENLPRGPSILTAWTDSSNDAHFCGCPHCRVWSAVMTSALGDEMNCAKCHEPLKMNPFTIVGDWRVIASAWEETDIDD